MRILGAIVFIGGIALLIGNLSGEFRTFPYAGYIGMGVGVILWGVGKKG